ncbi:methyltransferase domain-containing protein [Patescibacteria group bacterium]|nr:methyltransferase domain-containing protein [Patescibacteria group bacterium]
MQDLKYIYRRGLDTIRKIRSHVVRTLKPAAGYYIFGEQKRSLQPLSFIYGFDRGKPIDRYYIESFMDENKELIKGVCLEITDNDYTVKYGGDKVTKSDALDIDTNNKQATIYGDLRNLDGIADNTYDCMIVTQTFVMIDDFHKAVAECYRVLKPGGALLVTMPCLGRVGKGTGHNQFWRFTKTSCEYIFGKAFGKENVESKTYGNVFAGQCFWVGMASDELTKDELAYMDPEYPVIVATKAIKR